MTLQARLKHIVMLARTASALGFGNIARVFHYRFQKRMLRPPVGLHLPTGPYFRPINPTQDIIDLPVVSGWKEGGLLGSFGFREEN